MNIRLKFVITKILPVSAIPFLLAATSYLVQSIAVTIMNLLDLDKFGLQHLNDQEMNNHNTRRNIISLLEHTRKASMSVYDDYLHFMVAMTLLHAMIRVLALVVKCITIESKSLYSSTRNQPQGCLTDTNIKNWRSYVSPSEVATHSPTLQTKKMGGSILAIVIFCIFAYGIMHCVIYSHVNALDDQRGLPMLQLNDGTSLQGPFIHSIRLVDEENKYNNERNLDQSASADVIHLSGSLSIDEEIYSIHALNETQVWLFCFDKIIPVNVTDPMSLKKLESINISLDGPSLLMNFYLSPNAKTLIRSYFDTTIYISNVSDPEKFIKLNHKHFIDLVKEPIIAFSPDSERGYIATDNFYQFNISSGDVVEISSFQEMQMTSFVLSSDGRIAFIVLSNTSLTGVLRILDVTSSTPGDIPFDFMLDFASTSIAVSSDSNMLFLVYSDSIKVLNVTNKTSPNMIYSLSPEGIDDRCVLTLSPDDTTLIIQGDQFSASYIIDVSDPLNPVVLHSAVLSNFGDSQFSVDSKFIFLQTDNRFQVASVPVNLKLGDQLPFIPMDTTTTPILQNCSFINSVTVSHDGTKAFLACDQGVAIYLISAWKNFTYYSFIKTNVSTSRIILPADEDIIFVEAGEMILIVNISANLTVLSSVSNPDKRPIISPNSQTIFMMKSSDHLHYSYYVVDISDLSQPEEYLLLNDSKLYNHVAKFTTNGEIFVTGTGGLVDFYRILDPSLNENPLQWLWSDEAPQFSENIVSLEISPDNKTLLIIVETVNYQKNFLILYDVSNINKITYLSKIPFRGATIQDLDTMPRKFSPNPDIILLPQGQYILVIDISERKMPSITGYIQAYSINLAFAYLSNSSELPILAVDGTGDLSIITFEPEYMIYMSSFDFGRGETQNQIIRLVKKNSIGNYTLVSLDYQFITFSLGDVTFTGNDPVQLYPALPNWITYDRPSETLNIEPTVDEHIMPYQIYSTVSTKMKQEEFDNVVNRTSSHLVYTLISLGYIDSHYYLTPNFNLNEELILPAEYESAKKAIYNILNSHYFEVITPISVRSSLSLEVNSSNILIRSPSLLPFTVSVALLNISNDTSTPQCQFVTKFASRLTPVFDENNTVIYMQGLLFEVNDALQNIILNYKDNETICAATFSIRDDLNPVLNQSILNLSNYFTKYERPALKQNVSIQGIINKTSIHTGTFFLIILDNNIFTQDSLNFQILNPDLTPWLTQTDLSLSGTPPEPSWPQVQPVRYDVVLRVSNEYQDFDLPFSLEVQMSTAYYLKLLAKVLSVVGFWIYFYTIYNILAKRFYQDPRTWALKIGEEVTPQNLYPIAFLGRELKESRFIIRKLQKSIADDLKLKSMTTVKVAEYFVDPLRNQIDTDMLARSIDNMISNLSDAEKQKIRLYTPGVNCRKDLIIQLLRNELVMSQLSTKHEKKTKQAFMELKSEWMDLVQRDESFLWQFSVDESKLDHKLWSKELRANSMLHVVDLQNPYGSTSDKNYSDNTTMKINSSTVENGTANAIMTDSRSLRVELFDRSKTSDNIKADSNLKINISLLEDAIIAYAFKQQHLDVKALSVQILCKEKVDRYHCFPHMVSRFLNLDLKRLLLNKGDEIGYGVKYTIADDILQFSGVVNRNMKDRTIVMQVVNKRGRILREVWIKDMDMMGSGQNPVIELSQKNPKESTITAL